MDFGGEYKNFHAVILVNSGFLCGSILSGVSTVVKLKVTYIYCFCVL